jgi:hypothetical protein
MSFFKGCKCNDWAVENLLKIKVFCAEDGLDICARMINPSRYLVKQVKLGA